MNSTLLREDYAWLLIFVIILCYSQEALKHPSCYRLYITKVDKDFDCDVHFPDYDETLFKETRWVVA